MTLEEFRKEFLESVRVIASTEGDFELSAFVEVAVRTLADAGELADFERCHFRGNGTRNRSLSVDGFQFDDVDGSVRLLVADWRGLEAMETLTQTEGGAILGRVRAFAEDASGGKLHDDLENATEAYALAKGLYERGHAVVRYRIYLISDRVLSSRVRDWPEGMIGSVPVEFHIWDIARLHRVVESRTGRDDLEIDLSEYQGGGIPCLAASGESDQYKAYLCVIPGGILARLYDEYGSRLLEGNVRSFLSVRGKINKGIRTTIVGEPEMFFAYNNGIAATASEVELRDGRLFRVKDLQIVNGGQTTASLATALTKDKAKLDAVFVPMKVSVVPPERAGEVIPRIAKYANSQNRVSDADFFSNHEFHQRMEQISRRIWAPTVGGAQHETHWFYERARGQFVNEQAHMSKGERERFLKQNPREQLITKTDLAKVENAWRCIPHIVSLGAQKNFMAFAEWVSGRWNEADADFNEEYFHRSVARTILFRATERLVGRQPWYQGGYRANVVAYTVAKLSSMIANVEEQSELNYAVLWIKQVVSPALERQLNEIATAVFEVITHPPEGFQNVTEWCKKEQCWRQVDGLPLELRKDMNAELVDQGSDQQSRSKARAQQKVDNRIGSQIKVAELGKRYWGEMAGWARGRRLLTEDQEKLLSLAVRMPVIIPTEKQSAKLLELKARIETEGFRHAE